MSTPNGPRTAGGGQPGEAEVPTSGSLDARDVLLHDPDGPGGDVRRDPRWRKLLGLQPD
jgi:hypothetical protein